MSRKPEQGEIALYKDCQLRFSFVECTAGSPHTLTSDPWSFLCSHLKQEIKKRRGDNRKCAKTALYFAELAEHYYRAAQVVPLPTRATLQYYGMLNLAKCHISMRGRGTLFGESPEHHGLTLLRDDGQRVKVMRSGSRRISVFAEFCSALGKPVAREEEVSFLSALEQVPEVHGIYAAVFREKKPKLLPIHVEFLVNRNRNKLYTELMYDKRQVHRVSIADFYTGRRARYFGVGYDREGKVVFRAKRRKSFNSEHEMNSAYRRILEDYRRFDIVQILTGEGYRYYVNLGPNNFPHLANSLLAMFFLGTTARYYPVEMAKLLEGPESPLVNEFVFLTPKQYLYQLVSMITGRECVVPLARL